MAGLRKQKKYDWKDSNLALFGSDLERNVKKASASTEEAWKGAGQKVGIKIWRIVKFKVRPWPTEQYGQFFNGDSYIILNTYKDEDEEQLQHDVHFWIGAQSTQDEYGTAAYKTVELDTFLDDVPVQHREVQGFESSLFKSYFKTISILQGGAETGFRHVKAEEYKPRLLHFSGTRGRIEVNERPCNRASLNSGDVFILDLGLKAYQWNGKQCNKDEKFKALQFLQELKSERSGRVNVEALDEEDTGELHEFYTSLTEDADDTDGPESFTAKDNVKELFRLSDASGTLSFKTEKKGSMSEADLDTKDVFILDTKKELFVWVGKGTSKNERKNAMSYAHKYLMSTDHPLVSVSCVAEGRRMAHFNTAIAA